MPTYKKKRRHNKKTHRKRRQSKRGGQIIKISRITDAKDNYLGTTISRTAESKDSKQFNPYIEPTFDIDVEPHEAKYVNSVLFSNLKPADTKEKTVSVRVNGKKEEEQIKLYNYLDNDFKNNKNDDFLNKKDAFLNKYFKYEYGHSDEENLFNHIYAWNNRPNTDAVKDDADKTKYIADNKTNFPKYFEKNPASIPQKIDELKDDIYPLITNKIVEYFMDHVPENERPSIYVKGDTSTYNNIRYVIMKILEGIIFPIESVPDE